VNPYAPSASVDELHSESLSNPEAWREQIPNPPSLTKLWIRWTLVCLASAAPSFFIAYGTRQHPPIAMLLGILCFVVAYVWLDSKTYHRIWRRHPFVRRMLMFGYGTRIAISIIFPAGVTVDLICGLLAYSIVGFVVEPNSPNGIEKEPATFGTTFLLTIVQGTILNILLAAWCLICSGIVLLFKLFVRMIQRLTTS
jgi:hypothetical protein